MSSIRILAVVSAPSKSMEGEVPRRCEEREAASSPAAAKGLGRDIPLLDQAQQTQERQALGAEGLLALPAGGEGNHDPPACPGSRPP